MTAKDEYNFSFSELVNAFALFEWSPCGCYFAVTTAKDRVRIHNVRDDLLTKTATLPDEIIRIEWSADSSFCACSYKTGIHIFSVDNASWKCKLDLGPEHVGGVGLQDFSWSPDARHILTTTLDYVQLTIWSISNTTKITHIQDILPIRQNKAFSPDGDMLALARFDEEFSPCISLYAVEDWHQISTFRIICKDLQDIRWCPNNSSILLRDSMLFNNLYIYTPTGQLLKHYTPEGQLSIGVPLALWSPTGQFLVCLYHRNIIRVLNTLTYGLLLEEKLEPSLSHNYPNCQMISEIVSDISGSHAYEREIDSPIIPSTTTTSTKCKFQHRIKFSWDGTFFAVWTDSYGSTVWIYDASTLSIAAVLVHLANVSDFDWHPSEIQLCICTNTNLVYFWSLDSCFIKHIPARVAFQCKTVKWNPIMSSITLMDYLNDKLILCDIS